MSDPLAGQPINVDDFSGTLDAHGVDIDTLQAQMAAVAPTTRLRGVNATLNGAIGTMNPALTQAYWQGGSDVVATDAEGDAVIEFPVAFELIVVTGIVVNGDKNVGELIPWIDHIELDQIVLVIEDATGAPAASTNVRVNWLAVGL